MCYYEKLLILCVLIVTLAVVVSCAPPKGDDGALAGQAVKSAGSSSKPCYVAEPEGKLLSDKSSVCWQIVDKVTKGKGFDSDLANYTCLGSYKGVPILKTSSWKDGPARQGFIDSNGYFQDAGNINCKDNGDGTFNYAKSLQSAGTCLLTYNKGSALKEAGAAFYDPSSCVGTEYKK